MYQQQSQQDKISFCNVFGSFDMNNFDCHLSQLRLGRKTNVVFPSSEGKIGQIRKMYKKFEGSDRGKNRQQGMEGDIKVPKLVSVTHR